MIASQPASAVFGTKVGVSQSTQARLRIVYMRTFTPYKAIFLKDLNLPLTWQRILPITIIIPFVIVVWVGLEGHRGEVMVLLGSQHHFRD